MIDARRTSHCTHGGVSLPSAPVRGCSIGGFGISAMIYAASFLAAMASAHSVRDTDAETENR